MRFRRFFHQDALSSGYFLESLMQPIDKISAIPPSSTSNDGQSLARKFSVTEYMLGFWRATAALPWGGIKFVWKRLLLTPMRIGMNLLQFPFLLATSNNGLLSSSSASQSSPSDDKPSHPQFSVKEYVLGVWKLKVAIPSGGFEALFDTRSYTRAFYTTAPLLWRLAVDVYQVSPLLMTIYFGTLIWQAVDSPIQMYMNNKLLRAVSCCLSHHSGLH